MIIKPEKQTRYCKRSLSRVASRSVAQISQVNNLTYSADIKEDIAKLLKRQATSRNCTDKPAAFC